MISKAQLLEKYNISEETFIAADILWEDLEYIYNDFEKKRNDKYKAGIHSYRTRIKESEHLIVKIIRKRNEKYSKYKDLSKYNYEKFLTDLIGIRCFILFKDDWKNFDTYIKENFQNNPDFYIKDSLKNFDNNENHYYIAEAPKAHIRNGDDDTIYKDRLDSDCILSDKIYRSVHYILKYNGVYIEIQVRTLFEEGWGEVDHAIVYPYYEDNKIFKQYTEMLNRLTGLADEMGSFFKIVEQLEKEHINQISSNQKKETNINEHSLRHTSRQDTKKEINETPGDCLNSVLNE